MPVEKEVQSDDPQIHLLAAKYCEKFRAILQSSIDDEGIQVLKNCIQFFAHYIKYLPECCNDVLSLCRGFLDLLKDKSIQFDVAVVNRIVGICTTIMIRRKEEDVIRSACFVLKETVDMIPSATLNVIVTKYSKSLTLIFQKIYLAQTYFTQLRILEIFVFITKDLKKMLNDTILKHPLLRTAKEEAKRILIERINKIDLNDFENTSRKFLRVFNSHIFTKTSILSVEGRITKMNGHPIKQTENMMVNFNGRNLTISFFVPNNLFVTDDKEKAKKENDFLVFIEFECKSISSSSKVYKGRHYVDVSTEVNNAITYNGDMTRDNLDDIKKISLRLIDEEATLKLFTEMYYEKYKQHERMMSEQQSCADKMSIMTFRTSASMLDDLKTVNETKPQIIHDVKVQNIVKGEQKPKQDEKIEDIEIKPRNETIFDDLMVKRESTAPASQIKPTQIKTTRPKRQSAKKANDKLSDIFDEENMKNDEKITTTLRDFKEQQKKQKKDSAEAKTTKNQESQESNRNYYLEPVEVITRTTLKSKTTKFNKYESKPKHYDTEEENREVKRKERAAKKEAKKQEPKVQRPKTERKIKEPAERKPLATFDLNKDIANDKTDLKLTFTTDQKPIQKRKFPEIHAPSKLLMYDDIDMGLETAAPVKVVNSGRSPALEICKKKPLGKRPIEDDKKEIRPDLKLTFTKDQTPTQKQLQKRKFPEIYAPNKLLMDDDMELETAAPVKVVKQSINKFKVPSDKSVNSGRSPTPEICKKKPLGKRPMEDDKKVIRTEKRRRLTVDNVFEFSGSEKEPPKPTEVTSRVEEWLKSASDSFSFNVSGDNDDPEIPITENAVQNDVVAKGTQNADDNESEVSYGQFANDEHQHYSSSSHESMDLDDKNVPEQKQKAVSASTAIEKTPKFEYQSTSHHVTNASQNNNLIMDPCQAFNIRCSESVVELTLRKKKIDDSDRAIFKKFDQPISKYGKKCLDQVKKTKAQLKHVNQLHLRYESEKSKLMDNITEQEKMFQILKREISKRAEAMEIRNQSKQKELINLKTEALRKNEELMQDVWREYINNFQSSLNNSIQKAYEI